MSEEGNNSPVTPEKIEPDRRNICNDAADSSVSSSKGRRRSSIHAVHRRDSFGCFNAGNRVTRDSSTGKSASSSTSQDVVSRYLRASTGSCHDFCKYGMKHSPVEEKPRASRRERHAKTLPVELNPVQTMVLDGRKNVKVSSHELVSDNKARSSYAKPRSDTKSHSPKWKTPLDNEKAVKHKASTYSVSEFRKLKISPGLKNKVSPTKKLSSPYPPEMIKSVFFSSENAEDKSGQGSSAACDMPRSSKKMINPSGQHSSLKSINVKPVLSSDSNVVRGKVRKNSNDATGRNMAASKASAKKISAPSSASLSPKLSLDKMASNRSRKAGNLKSVSSPKVQNQVGGDNCNTSGDKKVLEKSLHVIETVAENNVYSICDDHAVSSFPSPYSPRSGSHAESSSVPSHEEDNKESGYSGGEWGKGISDNDKSLETSSALSIPNYHVSSVPSSPKALSHAESQYLLSHEEVEEIGHSNDEPHRCILDMDESLEIATVQFVPFGHAISLFSPPLSAESPSLAESSSSLPQEEDDSKEIEYLDGEAGESIPDNDSLEIGNMELDPVVRTISSFPSLSHAESSSSSTQEDGSKEIDYHEGEQHEYISESDASPEIGNVQSSPSSPKSLSSSWSSHGEDNDEIKYSNSNDEPTENRNVPLPAAKDHKTPRKSRAVISEDNHCSPVKLKFKPGRVIDRQADNNGPRRLRFRRGRDLKAEHRKSESTTLKKAGANGMFAVEETSSEKVVLKHQDVQDKKDPQVLLFNNVIEETASKLVETRKSKVKALVGAFETVISLQESKPSS